MLNTLNFVFSYSLLFCSFDGISVLDERYTLDSWKLEKTGGVSHWHKIPLAKQCLMDFGSFLLWGISSLIRLLTFIPYLCVLPSASEVES